MNGESHESLRELIAKAHVEGLSAAERQRLEEHLENCPECAREAAGAAQALRSLRAVAIAVPASLAERTQMRVYLRAREIKERRQGWVLWFGFAVSWVLGLASAPYVWHGFRWVGEHAGIPGLVWKAGFALWWALPALLAAGILLADRWGTPSIFSRRPPEGDEFPGRQGV
jgi:anti-sigma factor RsiW